MTTTMLIPNGLRVKRLAAGIDTPAELAARAEIAPDVYAHYEAGRVLPTSAEIERLRRALGGVPIGELYDMGYQSVIAGQRHNEEGYTPSTMYRDLADEGHLLLSREEATWFERRPAPDHKVDAFVNLSCGTQWSPHLLLDTVAVLNKLGVSFVAAAGAVACCGKPFINVGRDDTADRLAEHRIRRSVGWGARVHVNWCTACQITTTTRAARRFHIDGVRHPVREVQVLSFLAERVRELGDDMPWEQPVHRRVLAEGHPSLTPVLRDAQTAAADLLALIPGVEVVGLYDGYSEESPCVDKGRAAHDRGWTPPAWYLRQNTPEGVQEHRAMLGAHIRSLGADTIACQHQDCHLAWGRYASELLSVRHPVSILAEALGCAHPDRRQAAMRLGDPEAFVAQTRRVWQSWGLSQTRAREIAQSISDPTFADPATHCSCGGGGSCQESLIKIDVLAATARPVRPARHPNSSGVPDASCPPCATS